jgi:RNA polymerase sigma-70 factor (ECF subfamily)
MPDKPEALGLLALMLFQESRRPARVDEAGDLVPLDQQDRTRWDTDAIHEGLHPLDCALRRGQPGPYQVQAAIAACHATASTAESTDRREIAALYDRLAVMSPSPVIRLNQAVAIAMAEGPAAGLAPVEALEASGVLAAYHLLAAARGGLPPAGRGPRRISAPPRPASGSRRRL